jgi:hypothetical protein
MEISRLLTPIDSPNRQLKSLHSGKPGSARTIAAARYSFLKRRVLSASGNSRHSRTDAPSAAAFISHEISRNTLRTLWPERASCASIRLRASCTLWDELN